MNEIKEFCDICRLIAEANPKNKAKILQATNEWFAGFLEDFVAGVSSIIVRIHNNLDIKYDLVRLDEKMYRTHEEKKLIDWVMQEFTRLLPGARGELDAIKASINTVMIAFKEKEYDTAVETYNYIPKQIKALNKKLEKIQEYMLSKEIIVYACDEATDSPDFITQRGNKQLEDPDAMISAIRHIIDVINEGISPRAKEPRYYGGGLYGKVIGSAARLIFFEKTRKKEVVICVYIDEQTHNDAVNTNVRNIYRRIIDKEVTKDNYYSYRRINPNTLEGME